jgi:outer membrane protein OmpA-like peptidoglycan-associated protein
MTDPDSISNTNTIIKDETGQSKTEVLLEQNNAFMASTLSGDLIFRYEEGIPIYRNSAVISIPSSVLNFKYQLNTYLLEHPEAALHIISRYGADEKIQTPNMGTLRGQALRRVLIDNGLPGERIMVDARIGPLAFDENGMVSNGFSFEFNPWDGQIQQEQAEVRVPVTARESTVLRPMIVDGVIQADNDLKDLAESIERMLESDPNLQIRVTGHTDNIGNGTDNYALGLKYARQIRRYLIVKAGVDRKKIIALSKGESEPIDTNDTKAGRKANNRIEVEIALNSSE